MQQKWLRGVGRSYVRRTCFSKMPDLLWEDGEGKKLAQILCQEGCGFKEIEEQQVLLQYQQIFQGAKAQVLWITYHLMIVLHHLIAPWGGQTTTPVQLLWSVVLRNSLHLPPGGAKILQKRKTCKFFFQTYTTIGLWPILSETLWNSPTPLSEVPSPRNKTLYFTGISCNEKQGYLTHHTTHCASSHFGVRVISAITTL